MYPFKIVSKTLLKLVESQSWEKRCDDKVRSKTAIHSDQLFILVMHKDIGDIQIMIIF